MDDVVIITDHSGPSGFNTIAQVAEVLSDRTVKVRYVQRQAQCDRDGNIVKAGKIAFLIRPVRNLIYLTCPSERFTNLDPYVEGDSSTSTTTSTSTMADTATAATATSDPATAPTAPPSPPSDGDDHSDIISGDINDGIGGGGGDDMTSSDSAKVPRPAIKVRFIPEAVSEIKDINMSSKNHKKKKSKK